MRVALLSMLEHAGDVQNGHRAFLTFAGKSVALRQLELALRLGCERIVCISDNLAHPLIAMQHRVEAAGARFHVISAPRALCGLITAGDQLVVIADGILPLADEAHQMLAHGNAVLVLPADEGVAAGFERIDLNNAWAGVLSMPGRLVERLNQLPPDCDAISALLRIALQGAVPERPLPLCALSEGRWINLCSQAQADTLEPLWLRSLLPPPAPFAPGGTLANWVAGRWGMRLIDRGVTARLLFVLAWAAALAALAVGWYFTEIAGFMMVALAWILGRGSLALGLVEGMAQPACRRRFKPVAVFDAIIDLVLAFLIAMQLGERFNGWPALFLSAIALFGAVRVVAALKRPGWSELAADRLILPLILAAAAGAGILQESTEVLSLIALAVAITHLQLSAKLTQA